ncbi:hypothetical protein LSUE1_G009663, partial [Lachnellula suecica]
MNPHIESHRIFCCSGALPVKTTIDVKLYNNPNRELHEAIFRSFLAFSVRRQQARDLLLLITTGQTADSLRLDPTILEAPMVVPPFRLEDLKNNPLSPETPYCIHLVARHDFGPVYSHQYFACPENLEHDWVDISLNQWFAAGEPFKMKAERWDVKCLEDGRFFRLTLRPNLDMRCRQRLSGFPEVAAEKDESDQGEFDDREAEQGEFDYGESEKAFV